MKKELVLPKGVIAAAVVVVLLIVIFTTASPTGFQTLIQAGDTVEVEYTGKFTNGTVFDSGTLTTTIGNGQLISGFENALVGMKKGEEKVAEILPEQAYGEYDWAKVKLIDRYESINRYDEFILSAVEELSHDEVKIGNEIMVRTIDWPVIVKEINEQENKVVVENKLVNGSLYFPLGPFPLKVVGIDKDTVTFEKVAVVGRETTLGGKAWTVIDVYGDTIRLDSNHDLAGKTLVFEIKILDIER